jgi:hypothetical protein
MLLQPLQGSFAAGSEQGEGGPPLAETAALLLQVLALVQCGDGIH